MATVRSSTERLVSARQYLLVGLDVGGTKINGIAVDENLNLRSQVRIFTDTTSAGHAVQSIVSAIHQILNATGATAEEILAIGLGIPGKVQGGIVSHAVNLKLESFPLASTLTEIFGAPVVLENDVRAAALGVYQRCREEMPVENLAYLSIGTGISAGVILNGKLYRGSNGMAGEVGHSIVDPEGQRCNCGAYGCLETVAAGPAIAQQAGQAVAAGAPTLLSDFTPLTAESVFHAAQLGDPIAQKIVRRTCAYLSRAIYGLLMAYDVDVVALGGGVSHAGEAFLSPIMEELTELRHRSGLAEDMLSGARIMLSPRDFNAGEWGVITLAKQKLFNSDGSKSLV